MERSRLKNIANKTENLQDTYINKLRNLSFLNLLNHQNASGNHFNPFAKML